MNDNLNSGNRIGSPEGKPGHMGTATTKQPVLEINGQGMNYPISDINLIEKVDSVQIALGHKRDFILLSLRIE